MRWAGVFIVLVEDTVYGGEPHRPHPAVWDILQNGAELVIRCGPAQFINPLDPEDATWDYNPKYIVKASAVTA